MNEEQNMKSGPNSYRDGKAKSEVVKNEQLFPEDRQAPKPPSSNQHQEIENMEVHHHGHVHHQKKWKEYLFQFLMLFLAVTLGFFVENQREHYIERHRAKELAKGLLNDLIADSARIEQARYMATIFVPNLDEVIAQLKTPAGRNESTLFTYFQAGLVLYIMAPVPTETNLAQIKNSGSLRYFKNENLVRMLGEWDQRLNAAFKTRQNLDGQKLIEITKSANRVFDPVKLNEVNLSLNIYAPGFKLNSGQVDSLKNIPVPLITNNNDAINEFIGWAADKRYTIEQRTNGLFRESIDAIHKIIGEIRKEYHLE
jgi:hypothetical protein